MNSPQAPGPQRGNRAGVEALKPSSPHALTAVVADDEQLARDELCFQLEKIEGVEVVGQAANGVEALEEILRTAPDVAFLDIQMPGLTGFEVARKLLEAGTGPSVICVTAFDQRAIEAFEVNAVDYVLKPVDTARLETAVARARKRKGESEPLAGQLDRLVKLMAGQKGRRDQVAVKVNDRFVLVQADDIIHASLVEDSINIVTNQVSGTSNDRTLEELHARLDPEVFWRVHRSHLVNINKVKEIVPWFSRNYILRMKDAKATEIPVSRSQTRRLRDYLKL
jgi:two-component system response regulator LytT